MPKRARLNKRPDGFYQRSITVGRRPDGKPQRKTIYAKTLKELDAKAAEYERQLRHGTLSSDEKMTFGELAIVWLRDYKPGISITTRAMYKTALDYYLLPDLAVYKLKDLKPHHLQSIINRMAEKGKAESTIKKVKLTATQILQIAMDNDIVYRNVFTKATVPDIPAAKRRTLTDMEIRLIVDTYTEHRLGISALLLLYCGLRRGELIALTWNDIDIKRKSVIVNKAAIFDNNKTLLQSPKTEAGIRDIPLPDNILDAVKAAKKATRTVMVCPAADGQLMSLSAFQKAWKSYMHYLNIKAGGLDASRSRPKLTVIDNLTPHMFRHTYATILYNAGVDVKSAQRFLGHADINVTLKIYTHLSAQKEQDAIACLNRHLSDNPEGKNQMQ
jgi:integrase